MFDDVSRELGLNLLCDFDINAETQTATDNQTFRDDTTELTRSHLEQTMEVQLECNIQKQCGGECSMFHVGETEAYPAIQFVREWPFDEDVIASHAGSHLYVLLTEESVRCGIDGVVNLEEASEFKRVYDGSGYSTVASPGHDGASQGKIGNACDDGDLNNENATDYGCLIVAEEESTDGQLGGCFFES